MAVKMMTGDIMDNWGVCDAIYLSAHTDISPAGNYYLNNSLLAAVKNNLPDFNDIFTDKIKEARLQHSGKKDDLFGVATHKIEKNGELVQRIGLVFMRDKWNMPPRPEMLRMFLDGISMRISMFAMYNQPIPRIVVQDPITADEQPSDKAIEAIQRLYKFYSHHIEVWQPAN